MVSWPIRFTRAARQTVIWRCPLRNWHRLDEFFVNNRKVQWVACANLPSRYTQYIPTTYRLCPCSPNIHEYRSCLVSHKQLVNLVLIVTDDNGLQICGLNERAISDLSLCVCFHFFFFFALPLCKTMTSQSKSFASGDKSLSNKKLLVIPWNLSIGRLQHRSVLAGKPKGGRCVRAPPK